MLNKELLLRTALATSRMTVRELFHECLRAHVQALPFSDDAGRISGRVTLKRVIQQAIIPDYMAQLAHVMPSELNSLKQAQERLRAIFDESIAPYVQEPHVAVPSSVSLGKALATMEQHDTSYLFVIDDGEYQGTLTIQGIAQHELGIDETFRPGE